MKSLTLCDYMDVLTEIIGVFKIHLTIAFSIKKLKVCIIMKCKILNILFINYIYETNIALLTLHIHKKHRARQYCFYHYISETLNTYIMFNDSLTGQQCFPINNHYEFWCFHVGPVICKIGAVCMNVLAECKTPEHLSVLFSFFMFSAVWLPLCVVQLCNTKLF